MPLSLTERPTGTVRRVAICVPCHHHYRRRRCECGSLAELCGPGIEPYVAPLPPVRIWTRPRPLTPPRRAGRHRRRGFRAALPRWRSRRPVA